MTDVFVEPPRSQNLYTLEVDGKLFTKEVAMSREDARKIKRELEKHGYEKIKITKYSKDGYVR